MGADRAASGRQRGSAAVEFALVLPLLLLVCLALLQIGLLARDRLLLVQAARAAARQAAVDPDPGSIRSVAVAAAPGLDPLSLELDVARSGGQGDPVRVTVRYEEDIAPVLAGLFFPSSVRLDASATMRQEFP